MRYLNPTTLDGITAAGWVLVGDRQIEVDATEGPLDGIELALRGLDMINRWLAQADPADGADVQAVLVGPARGRSGHAGGVALRVPDQAATCGRERSAVRTLVA